jgi:hypothetical protein
MRKSMAGMLSLMSLGLSVGPAAGMIDRTPVPDLVLTNPGHVLGTSRDRSTVRVAKSPYPGRRKRRRSRRRRNTVARWTPPRSTREHKVTHGLSGNAHQRRLARRAMERG